MTHDKGSNGLALISSLVSGISFGIAVIKPENLQGYFVVVGAWILAILSTWVLMTHLPIGWLNMIPTGGFLTGFEGILGFHEYLTNGLTSTFWGHAIITIVGMALIVVTLLSHRKPKK